MVKSESISDNKINVRNLASGYYFNCLSLSVKWNQILVKYDSPNWEMT